MADISMQRKLRAIFSADVKGYSKLMGEDDELTVNTITAYREIMSDFVKEHQGRVVDSPGDNILAEFGSTLNAVNSAIAIQQRLEQENEKLPFERRMLFRIGINLGEIIQKGNRIYGDGVNVAARIESLADPGGICISRNVFDQIKKKVSQGFEYMGEHKVKNIAEPIRIYRVLLAPEYEGRVIGEQSERKNILQKPYAISIALILLCSTMAIWFLYPRPAKIQAAAIDKMAYPLPEKPSIVVLPFNNTSGKSEEDYFSDGLTEQIITTLSVYPRIFVITRQSAFHYKGKPVEVGKAAEELGVHYVLTGGVQKSGGKLRITVQLIDALSGTYIWSERYDRQLTDIFQVQDEITATVLNAMVAELTEGEQARRWTQKAYNLKALEKHYRAQGFFCRHTKEDYDRAMPLFEESIAIEPDFVWPYVYLGYAHLNIGARGLSESPKESFEKAFELAQKAISIDDSHDGAHSLLASYYNVTRQYEKALPEVNRAIELNPNAADAKAIKGSTLSYLGRWEQAVLYGKKALRLNPYPGVFPYMVLGRAYFMTGQYDESIEIWKKAIQVSPNYLIAHRYLAACYASLDRIEEAQSAVKEVIRINPNFSIESHAKRLLFKNKADIEREITALRKAGFPEYPPLPLPDKPSIAVLPFDNLSGDPEQEYFSDGFTEQIITSLSKIPYIVVIARQSSFAFRNKQMTVQQIAKELGVKYILEGSIQRSNDQLRITAQLIDANSGHHIWAEYYDRKIKDIFALQDEIAMKIMAELQVNIAYETSGRYATIKTTNLKAYEKIIQGGELFLRRTEGYTLEARKLAEEAIALDPNYGIAYTLLGWTHLDDIWFYRSKDRDKSLKKAEQLAHKAIDLSGTDPTSHRLLGCVFMLRKQYEKAIVEMQKAVELSPNSASSIFFYGLVLRFAGRYDEAIPILEKAIRLNPVTPVNYLNNLAWSYALSEQYEKAIPLWNMAIERNPDYLFAYSGLTCTHQLLGNEEKAREAAAEVLRIKPTYTTAQIEEFDINNIEQKNRLLEAYHKAGIPKE